MPGATLPNMLLLLPTSGGDSGEWGDIINGDLQTIDAHTHEPGNGIRISTAAIDINADLTFAGFAATNLGRAAFSAVAALSSGARTLFVNSADNELYWRTNSGANVKLTSGTALNVAAFTGGIGGDYTAAGAEVAYDAANERYTFRKAGTPRPWVRLASSDIRLYEHNSTESVYVGLAAPAALGASYTITLPTAAPGTQQLVQMTSLGALTASNTIPEPVVTGSSVTAGGLITASAGVTCAVNQSVTVSGTGRFRHGAMTMSIPASAFCQTASGTAVAYGTAVGIPGISGSSFSVIAPIALPVGARILAVRVYIEDNSTGPTRLTLSVVSTTSTGVTENAAGPTAPSAGTGANQTLSLGGLTLSVVNLTSYSIVVLTATGAASCSVRMAEVDYDFP